MNETGNVVEGSWSWLYSDLVHRLWLFECIPLYPKSNGRQYVQALARIEAHDATNPRPDQPRSSLSKTVMIHMSAALTSSATVSFYLAANVLNMSMNK